MPSQRAEKWYPYIASILVPLLKPPYITITSITAKQHTLRSNHAVLQPEADEQSDWDTVEVKDKEWTDEELMDDARPGRREFPLVMDGNGRSIESKRVVEELRFSARIQALKKQICRKSNGP
ncbi:hypothetical protein B0T12DRAFT_501167 [Alternaria alternata]|nr:hypothetical protein B0T12DRAFT_501167 [Alternaria alternata]